MHAAAFLLALLVALPVSAQTQRLGSAYATLTDDRLTLGTGRFTRTFRWNDGHLASSALHDETLGKTITLVSDGPDIKGPGIPDTAKPGGGTWRVRLVAADGLSPAHLDVSIEATFKSLALRRRCTVVPGSSAISCSIAFRGTIPAHQTVAASREMIESEARARDRALIAADRLTLPGGPHWRADAVRLQAATDYHDTLVQRSTSLLYREPRTETGALLHLSRSGHGSGLFILREAPLAADQIAWPGSDFLLSAGEVVAVAAGIDPSAADSEGWVEAYPVTVGLTDGSEQGFREALRSHMALIRPYVAKRDSVIMSNSWGDRSRDSRMNEAFMLAEIKRAADAGLTVVQLDDGWQAGLSKNSANKSGTKWEDWSAEDWQPHRERFPRGLGPVVAAAKKRGLSVGIWFNPSQLNDFAAWRRDADILIGLWRQHGIRYVKIDGVNVPNRRAEANLVRLFERVSAASSGAVVMNMDVTAGRRPAYFSVNRYGNIFLENRYTDWANYYPHRTLRNVWQLAAFLPPQWLQAEFLNIARNQDRYAAEDPLSPARVGQTYAFAASWAAQPLAWMELTGLAPDALQALAPDIRAYRRIQEDLHGHAIFPIGSEPDGSQLTGFQSFSADRRSGYLLLYREPLAADTEQAFSTLFSPGQSVWLDTVIGTIAPGRYHIDAQGKLTLPLHPGPSAQLITYTVVN